MLMLRPLLPGLSFAAFVFWLLAVPMNGPLAMAAGIEEASRYFLLPHVAALLLLGGFCPATAFTRVVPPAVVLTIVLSLFLPFYPDLSPFLLVFLSLSGAIVALAACSRLQCSARPLRSAAGGLVWANLALLALTHRPEGLPVVYVLTTLPLGLLLLPVAGAPPRVHTELPADASSAAVQLWHYLPFVLAFHVVSGLMYSVIYPAYAPSAWLSGLELPFYMGAVAAALFVVKSSREMLLVLGVFLGMGAFILLKWEHPAGINLSMFFMQGGQGFVDMFLLAFLLGFPGPLRAFGFGLATLCLGIYGGQFLSSLLPEDIGAAALYGHLFLNLAVLALYQLNRRQVRVFHQRAFPAEQGAPGESKDGNAVAGASDENPVENISFDHLKNHEGLRLLLSEQEFRVLNQCLAGNTYREIALKLDISESSVKTYMKRICDKLGATGRRDLFRRLAEGNF